MNPQPTPKGAEPTPDEQAEARAGLIKAVFLGLRDTWDSMLAEGRRSARATSDRRWRDFEARTRHRRHRDH